MVFDLVLICLWYNQWLCVPSHSSRRWHRHVSFIALHEIVGSNVQLSEVLLHIEILSTLLTLLFGYLFGEAKEHTSLGTFLTRLHLCDYNLVLLHLSRVA